MTTKDGRVSLNGYLKELEDFVWKIYKEELEKGTPSPKVIKNKILEFVRPVEVVEFCLLYTSDAADERSSVDLGGRRIIKKKKRT